MLDAGSYKMRQGIPELIAGIALAGIEGVSGIGIRIEHPEDARKRKNLSRGIKAEVDQGKIALEIDVNMEYGKEFMQLAMEIQGSLKEMVAAMTGWDVVEVNVNVVGVNAL
ncbi:MAG: Asp23/Gls24 family envelope stress response protein [Actinobacteria bacterium]|nr:Asp23/Gls24 family envelope stress response protein [Actinomycetota bacterium]